MDGGYCGGLAQGGRALPHGHVGFRDLFLQTIPARIKPHSQHIGGGDMFSTDPSSLKVLVVGDSFSMNLFNALYMHNALYSRLNIEFARYGTGPGLMASNPTGVGEEGSESHTKLEALRYSEEDFRLANVVIFSWRWRYMFKFEQPLYSLCKLFSGVENKTIIVAGKRPEFAIQQGGDFDQITELYWKYQTSHGFSAAGMNRFFFENANFFLEENALLREQAESCSFKFLGWKSVVCELLYKECLGVTPNGMPVYQPDGAHWSLGGFKAFGLKLYHLDWFGLRSLASLASDLNN